MVSFTRNMTIENFPHIQERIVEFSSFAESPEARDIQLEESYSFLSEQNQQFLSPVKEDLKIYLNCLKKVPRWQNHYFDQITSTFEESDYDHVLSMLKISQEYKENNPDLSINFNQVELLILLHDGGEIVTGDISLHHSSLDEAEIKEIKKFESRAFPPLILRRVGDLSVRKTLSNLYKRYESRLNNPSDSESHLVKLIDMVQGNKFALDNIYAKDIFVPAYPESSSNRYLETIIDNLFNKELKQLTRLITSLENQQEKEEFFSYYSQKHLSLYSDPKYGFEFPKIHFKDKIKNLQKELFS